MLRAHWVPLATVAGLLGVDGAAQAGATPLHFAAAGMTILGIVVVVKGYTWVRHEVGEQIGGAITLHNAEDEIRHQKIRGELAALRSTIENRPCIIATHTCRNHED